METRHRMICAALCASVGGLWSCTGTADGTEAADARPTPDAPLADRETPSSDAAISDASVPDAAPPEAIVDGPLRGLPAADGPTVQMIRDLPPGEFLNLGRPEPDPEWGVAPGRAYSNEMVAAPELHGAFIYGEGVHGATTERMGREFYNDDLFFYDIAQHRWVCVHPGTDMERVLRTVDERGFEVTSDG
ncbi:MAG: hypothetical protein AAGF12_00005, partial [Myxococcota bacterium]